MTNEEAKFILNAYRANGADASDPAFSVALEQAKNDPTLATWFERELAHAGQVTKKLREIGPPAELRGAILAGAQLESRAQTRRGRLPQIGWAAAAALVIAGTSFWMFGTKSAPTEERLLSAALDHATHGEHGGHGAMTSALQTRLATPGYRLSAGLPVDFAALKANGCRTLRVAGRDVLEVCFVREGAEFHLYVARAEDFHRAGEGAHFTQRAKIATAAWADERHQFVLVSDAGMDAVKRLL